MANDHTDAPAWLVPEGEQQGLIRYLETVRERWRLIALVLLVTTLATALFVALADERYESKSKLLVTPVSRDNDTLTSLGGLIVESSDPTRDVETAAQLITTVEVARRVRDQLGVRTSPRDLLDNVEALPVAGSSIVALTASSSDRLYAQQLANAFGVAAVQDRTAKLHRELDARIRNISAQLDSGEADGSKDLLRSRLTELQTLRAGSDPTLKLETRAEPARKVWPRTRLSIVAGAIVGLLLGLGGAFGAQLLDPRLRREDQVRRHFRLPVLARIPDEGRSSQGGVISPHQLSPAAVEAFRALRATVIAPPETARAETGRAVMVTSSSPSEGKTTTAVNLAASLALAGKKVILVEADLRRPRIGEALGVNPGRGIVSVLIDGAPLVEALTSSDTYGDNLKLLLADRGGEWIADQFALPPGRRLVEEAKQMADFVVIDSPPLTAVIDALPLAQLADDLVVVVRLGVTRLNRLLQLGELLAHHGIRPLGIALVGVPRASEYGYYGRARRPRALASRAGSEERETLLPTR